MKVFNLLKPEFSTNGYMLVSEDSKDYVLLSEAELNLFFAFANVSLYSSLWSIYYGIVNHLSFYGDCLMYKDTPVLYGTSIVTCPSGMIVYRGYFIIFMGSTTLVFRTGTLEFVGSVSSVYFGIYSAEVARLVMELKEFSIVCV